MARVIAVSSGKFGGEKEVSHMRLRLLTAAATLLVAAGVVPVLAQLPPLPFTMRAFAVNMTNVSLPRGNAGMMQIRITGWSSEAERKQLIETMIGKGQNALLSALQKVPVKGRISLPNWQGPDPQNYRLGWNLRYTWHDALPDGGERIVIGTDRQMSMMEVRERPRSFDYPFTLLEIRIPKDGKGEGRLFGATQIQFDKKKNQIVLEQYSAGEVRLNEITIDK
jgi:hypothetical protein